MKQTKQGRGFTLLELLIVIAIIAILSVILVLVLNPAETLKKSRDAQRISDLSTVKTALGLILTSSSSPSLGTNCLNGGSSATVYYSAELADSSSCAVNITEGADANGTFAAADFCKYPGTTGASAIDGSGWIPVNFGWLTGGSPISNLPLDPVNTISTVTTPTSTDMVYRYACQSTGSGAKPGLVFEVDTILESAAYTSDDDKRAKDGGDNPTYYEVGTNLKLIGTGANF